MFWGTETISEPPGPWITPPQNLTGQVWCDLNAPDFGYYLFVAQVQANGDPHDYGACIECGIDDLFLGQRQLFAVGPYEQFFLLELPAGIHRFAIKQVSGIIFFLGLTAWQIPILRQ
jgi:hypothetical protein